MVFKRKLGTLGECACGLVLRDLYWRVGLEKDRQAPFADEGILSS